MRRVVMFLAVYATWLLLVFPYDAARVDAGLEAWDLQSIVLGVGVAAFCAIILPTSLTEAFSLKMLNPVRWFWAAVYVLVLAYEILIKNHAVASHIRESKTHQTRTIMESSRAEGMITMDWRLKELFDAGAITWEEVVRRASSPATLEQMAMRAARPPGAPPT